MGSEFRYVSVADAGARTCEGRWQGGRFRLMDGTDLDRLEIAYWTAGALDDAASNAILLCPSASGDRAWATPFCPKGGCFDPDRWFVVSVDLPGGGDSSRALQGTFPVHYSIADLANALASFIKGIGLRSVRAFCGASMAGLVGLDLASRFPALIGGLALWQGGYRCDGYARAVAATVPAILDLDHGPAVMKAAARSLLPALLDRSFLASMDEDAQERLIERIANDWTAMWSAAELAARYGAMAQCDLTKGRGGVGGLASSIQCELVALATTSDGIFPAGDWQDLVDRLPRARLRTIDSPWGHMASAAPRGSAEFDFFERETARFLHELAA